MVRPVTRPYVLYELREYLVSDGRIEDELARARTTILADRGESLFERHGIPRPWGIFRGIYGRALPCIAFIYVWNGARQRADAFPSLYQDPDWIALRAKTNGPGEIVDRIDDLLFRGLPPGSTLPAGGYYEFCREDKMDALADAGMAGSVLGPLEPLCGQDPRRLTIVTRPDALNGDRVISAAENLFVSIGLK